MNTITGIHAKGRVDINSKDQHGQCALHLAAKNLDFEKLNFLLQDIELHSNAVDNYGKNALHYIMESPCFKEFDKFERCVLLLLENGVDVNAQDQMRETPLHKIFQNDKRTIPKIFNLLLRNGKNVNHELNDLDGLTLFHIMVSDVDVSIKGSENSETMIADKEQMIRDYISGRIVDIPTDIIRRLLNEPDYKGFSAFYTYVDSDHTTTETINIMINIGADVNKGTNMDITPLMIATLRARDDIVDILLSSGADVNKRDIFNQTAIFRARTDYAFDRLCEYGAEPNVTDKFGRCPIANRSLYTPFGFPNSGLTLQSDLAMTSPLALRFLQHGVDVNSTDRFGSTLLHYAAWHSDTNMVQVLLENGASKNSIDRQGYTPFDLAVNYGNFEVFSLLECENNSGVVYPEIEKQKRYGGYIRYIINHRELEDMERTLNRLNIEDNAEDLVETLLFSPRMGMTDKQIEFREIKQDIQRLMSRIASKVTELDSRFKCTLFPTGSSSEGSQISDTVEMDFVLSLDYFESQCEVIQTEDVLYKGFARLKICDVGDSHPLIGFIDEKAIVLSHAVRDRFTDLIVQAVNRKETWASDHVYFDSLLDFPDDKPIVNMSVEWYGAKAKSVNISIDIVPAIHKKIWAPKDIDLSKMTLVSERVKEAGFFLLFHTPQKSSKSLDSSFNLLRISSAPMEIEILHNVPDIFRESYAISKILKSLYFCPHVQFSDDEDDFSSGDNESFDEMPNEKGNSSDTSDEHIFHKDERLIPCIIPASKNAQENFENSSMAENGGELHVEKSAGWVVLVDDEEKIRKIHMPKENKSKSLEKLFEKVTRDAPSVHVIKEVQGINVETIQMEGNFETTGDEITRSLVDDEDKKNASAIDMINTSNENDTESNLVENIETETDDITEENDSLAGSSNLSDDFIGGAIVSAKDEISSYMLKNCVFYTILKIRDENLTDLSHLKITKMIYETLLSKAQEKRLPAYIIPYIDVFSYVNTEIRLLSENKARSELTKQCQRIESFCKLILGILSQTRGGKR